MQIGHLRIDCPAVMGILNLTPDSFSDGGRFVARDAALRQADAMTAAGAAILDIGGESTRPGAEAVSAEQELSRIMPVIEALRASSDLPISVDTSKAAVIDEVAAAGVDMINDTRALREDGALDAAAASGLVVCLMHMQGEPRRMQSNPTYADVTSEVAGFLASRRDACVAAGIDEARIVLDPGFGFGKSNVHNIELLANLPELGKLGRPLLVGLSRKRTLGALTGRDVGDRLAGSIAAAVMALVGGAHIVRVHDVAETVDALKVVRAVMQAGLKQ